MKGTNEGSSNPPINPKGDRNGMPFVPPKAGPLPNPLPQKPTARETGYSGRDRVGK